MTFDPRVLTNTDLTEEERAMYMESVKNAQELKEAQLSNAEFTNLAFQRAGKALGQVVKTAIEGPDETTDEALQRAALKGEVNSALPVADQLRQRAAKFREAGRHSVANQLEAQAIRVQERAAALDVKRDEISGRVKIATLDRQLKERGMDLKQLQEMLKNNLFTPDSKNKFLKSRNVDDLDFRKNAIEFHDDPNKPGRKIMTYTNTNGQVQILNRDPSVISVSNDAKFEQSTDTTGTALDETAKASTAADTIIKSSGLLPHVETAETVSRVFSMINEARENAAAVPRLKSELMRLGRADSNPSSQQMKEVLTNAGLWGRFEQFVEGKITGTLTNTQAADLTSMLNLMQRTAQDAIRGGLPNIQDSLRAGAARTGQPLSRENWNLATGRLLRAGGFSPREAEDIFGEYSSTRDKGALPMDPTIRASGKNGEVAERNVPGAGPLTSSPKPGSQRGVARAAPTSRVPPTGGTGGAIDLSKFLGSGK